MTDRGEITPEEYEQTRARVISKVKGRARQEEREKKEAAESDGGVSDFSPDEGSDGSSDSNGDADNE